MIVEGDKGSRDAGKGYIGKFVIASRWVGRIGGWVSGLFCSARPGFRKDLIFICLSCLRLRM